MQIIANSTKDIDTLPIRHLLVQGEANMDRIEIVIPYRFYEGKDISGLIYRIRAVNEDRDQVIPDQILPKTVKSDSVSLTWIITKAYTITSGKVSFEVVGSNSAGTDVIKFTGDPIAVRSAVRGYTGTFDFTDELISQLMLQFGEYVQQSKDHADRSGREADRSKNEADRAKAEADRVISQTEDIYNKAHDRADKLYDETVTKTDNLYQTALGRADQMVDAAVQDATGQLNAAADYAADQGQYAKEQGDYAKGVGDSLIAMKEAGLFKGEKGDKGDSGVTVPVNGLFTLGIEDGALYVYYSDEDIPPQFEMDEEGGLYYITPDE